MTNPTPPPAPPGERIAKVIARAGLCSRRDAERWIAGGRVSVNGVIITSPALNIQPEDKVCIDGKPMQTKPPTRLWRFHKPAGCITSHHDPQGRTTVFDLLPPSLPRVISIGRLDLNTEGLLLLTNDGELARTIELPATGWERTYRVRVHGTPDPHGLQALAHGVTIDGIRYGKVKASVERNKASGSNHWLSMTISEGKNREIRKLCAHLGLQVTRLIRTRYGMFSLDQLARGAIEEIRLETLQGWESTITR